MISRLPALAAALVLAALANAHAATVTEDGARPSVRRTSVVRIAQASPSGQSTPPASQQQAAPEPIGSIASLQGNATVTRGNATGAFRLNDDVYMGDVVQTGANSTLGIALDDETTFTMGANTRMTLDEFVYQKNGKPSAGYNVLRGTVAFVAGQVAKTGSMSISTPTATLGIRGTTGVIDVPENITGASQVNVKLYPDANGAVGRIELFAPGTGGTRLGILTRASSGFGIGAAIGGRFSAVPITISPQQIARDRGFVRQVFSHQNLGRQLIQQRRPFRQQGLPPNLQRQNLQRPDLRGPGRPGQVQPGLPQRGNAAPGPGQVPGIQRGPVLQGAPALRGAPGLRPPQQQQQRGRGPRDRRNERDR